MPWPILKNQIFPKMRFKSFPGLVEMERQMIIKEEIGLN